MKAFIFDFDGVIVDSERQWRELGSSIFYPSVMPMWAAEHSAYVMGLNIEQEWEYLRAIHPSIIEFEEYRQRKRRFSHEQIKPNIQAIPGFFTLLEQLERMNISVAIGSSASRGWIEYLLEQIGASGRFPIICSGDDVEKTKPAPDIYLLAAKKLNLAPEDCVVLEDSIYGLIAAKEAGMKCIVFHTDLNAMQDLSKADHIVRHYDELTEEVLKNL